MSESATPPCPVTTLPFPRHGLYAVTDTTLCQRLGIIVAVRQVIEGGAAVIQYRDKSNDSVRRYEESTALLEVCRAASIPLVINDDIELAASVGADGVHLGKHDDSLTAARSALGEHAIVGVSCYASIDRALQAQSAGATYVALGSLFISATKPDATRASLQQICQHRSKFDVPVVGIGGITADNASESLNAGIDVVAVISGLFAEPHPQAAAHRFRELFASRDATRP